MPLLCYECNSGTHVYCEAFAWIVVHDRLFINARGFPCLGACHRKVKAGLFTTYFRLQVVVVQEHPWLVLQVRRDTRHEKGTSPSAGCRSPMRNLDCSLTCFGPLYLIKGSLILWQRSYKAHACELLTSRATIWCPWPMILEVGKHGQLICWTLACSQHGKGLPKNRDGGAASTAAVPMKLHLTCSPFWGPEDINTMVR